MKPSSFYQRISAEHAKAQAIEVPDCDDGSNSSDDVSNSLEANSFDVVSNVGEAGSSKDDPKINSPGISGEANSSPLESSRTEVPVINDNERNVEKIISSMKITPETSLEEMEKAFGSASNHKVPEDILILFKEFRMWRQGPGGAQVIEVTAEMAEQRLQTMARGMKITRIDDFWNFSILWKYFFYKKKSGQWAGTTSRSYICTAKYFLFFF